MWGLDSGERQTEEPGDPNLHFRQQRRVLCTALIPPIRKNGSPDKIRLKPSSTQAAQEGFEGVVGQRVLLVNKTTNTAVAVRMFGEISSE